MVLMAQKNSPLGSLLIVITSFFWLPTSIQANPSTFQPGCVERTLVYQMRGEIRLLIFWVGRDEVGGGKVSSRCGIDQESGETWQEIEVLFGSNPERVPGGINRWGYGRERAFWGAPSVNRERHLSSTVFSGVMRRSKEESASQALKNEQSQKSKNLFWFDAIESVVRPHKAHSRIHIFPREEEFDYRRPELLLTELQELVSSSPPHEEQELENRENLYDTPYGFLSGLSSLIDRVISFSKSESDAWINERPSLIYIYDSKPYRLSVQKIKKPETHRLSAVLEGQSIKDEVPNTSEIRFRIENLTEHHRHEFTLWIPLEGNLGAVPVRIVYQPRWWLRIKLDLTSVAH